jgi:chorismate mutase/prephenate dehydratase
MKITNLRKKIDKIDKNILKLLSERANVSLAIGKSKSKKGASIYVPDREEEVYKRVIENNQGPLSDDSLKAVYREIMSGSLALERPLKIAYLGPEATFTHIAALKKFGESLDYLECKSISEVFTEVERGRADYGVVPIENSTEGAVNHTLDVFVDSDLKICSEVYLQIEHNILSKHKKISSIKNVYSNEQVFAQCRIWLEKNMPNVKLASYASTTQAAMLATSGKGRAAIASELAAERYGLRILARSIQDSPHNITRFLVIGKQEVKSTKHDKTSVVFTMKDRAGALHDVLIPFKKNNINLTKIESRPSKKRAWKYYFFVDLDGHHDNVKVKWALSALKEKCLLLKVLGSYPKAS